MSREAGKPPCPCYRCRYNRWRKNAKLRESIGMKFIPPRPVKDPSQPKPCPCHHCQARTAYNRAQRALNPPAANWRQEAGRREMTKRHAAKKARKEICRKAALARWAKATLEERKETGRKLHASRKGDAGHRASLTRWKAIPPRKRSEIARKMSQARWNRSK